jgi:hypothetical protein
MRSSSDRMVADRFGDPITRAALSEVLAGRVPCSA